MARHRDLLFGAAALAAVVLAVALGFQRLGPRENRRAWNADARRVEDLRAISRQIGFRQAPPSSLAELAPSPVASLRDPVTNAPYECRPKSGTTYELCATFAKDSAADAEGAGQRADFWSHPKGRYCYQLDAARARSAEPPAVR
jgi:hypothetical protein